MNLKKVERALLDADVAIVSKGSAHRKQDLVINDASVLQDIRRDGLAGLGDAYVDGKWDVDSLDDFYARLIANNVPRHFRNHPATIKYVLAERFTDRQTLKRSRKVGKEHYDLPVELFEHMLGPTMQYSCGYWNGLEKTVGQLDSAQTNKMDLIAQKLHLEPGMSVLDIGCGWGGLAKHLSERYGALVMGVTISEEQARYARKFTNSSSVEIEVMDYRDVPKQFERFDRVVSVGMFEHVGPKHYREYLQAARDSLRSDGLFLLHTIGAAESSPNRNHSEVVWMDDHIFPNFVIPSLSQTTRAAEGLFVVEGVENFGADYDTTLMAWSNKFDASWRDLSEQVEPFRGMSDLGKNRFYRMWDHYLKMCAGAFRARNMYQLWQIPLSPEGVRGGYRVKR